MYRTEINRFKIPIFSQSHFFLENPVYGEGYVKFFRNKLVSLPQTIVKIIRNLTKPINL